MSVDYSPEAIARRLREAAREVDLRPDRRLDAKVDYRPAAIGRRLRTVADLTDACLRLGTLGS